MTITLFLVVFISSIAYILGGMLIFIKKNWSQTSLAALSAMSAGLLLSIAMIDIIPDTQQDLSNNTFFAMIGFVFMYLIFQLTNSWKKEEKENKNFEQNSLLGFSIGMVIHNFFEGLSIGISYAVNIGLGIAVSLALVLHKVPEGISYSSSAIAISQNRKKTAIQLLIKDYSPG